MWRMPFVFHFLRTISKILAKEKQVSETLEIIFLLMKYFSLLSEQLKRPPKLFQLVSEHNNARNVFSNLYTHLFPFSSKFRDKKAQFWQKSGQHENSLHKTTTDVFWPNVADKNIYKITSEKASNPMLPRQFFFFLETASVNRFVLLLLNLSTIL